MGKVGSRSVVNSLESLNLGVDIEHVHYFNNLAKIEETIRNSWYFSEPQMLHIKKCKRVRQDFDRLFDNYHWHIITLVRDSIARSISSYFYNRLLTDPNWPEQFEKGNVSVARMISDFKKNIKVPDQSCWFDEHISDVFGINVFDLPSDKSAPYFIYRKNNISILLLKTEKLSDFGEQAFQEFLGIRKIRLVNSNQASEKPYKGLYEEFKKRITFTKKEMEKIYSFRLMNHFYTKKEVRRFMNQWSV